MQSIIPRNLLFLCQLQWFHCYLNVLPNNLLSQVCYLCYRKFTFCWHHTNPAALVLLQDAQSFQLFSSDISVSFSVFPILKYLLWCPNFFCAIKIFIFVIKMECWTQHKWKSEEAGFSQQDMENTLNMCCVFPKTFPGILLIHPAHKKIWY